MKNKVLSFLSGVLVTLMLVGLPVSALAANGTFRIEGSPINVLVNGEVFRPKVVNGNDVLVFVYNGTTYAPLRALAEAYGLEVGYDGSKNLATVNHPSTPASKSAITPTNSDFASAWEIKEKPVTRYGDEKVFTAKYNGSLSIPGPRYGVPKRYRRPIWGGGIFVVLRYCFASQTARSEAGILRLAVLSAGEEAEELVP